MPHLGCRDASTPVRDPQPEAPRGACLVRIAWHLIAARVGYFIATAVAIAPTRVLLLPRADLLALCHRRPAVALVMLEALARRVRSFAGIVTDLAFRPVTERLAHYIVAAVAHPIAPGAVVELGLTHTQLAARLGTVRELVSRALAGLEACGAIARARGQGRIVIRDPAQLEALARGGRDVT